jgi:hypothetical protein
MSGSHLNEDGLLTLKLFAKRSLKNLPINTSFDWFEYGAFYHNYQENFDGIRIHKSSRFFEVSTGKVWIPKENILLRINPSDGPGVYVTKTPKCAYLENPLCSNLMFVIDNSLMKLSKQPPREFEEVLSIKNIKVEIRDIESAKQIFEKYFN